METIIKAENISMSFRMDQNKITSLKEWVMMALKRQLKHVDFCALRDVSFSINAGEVIGVIGRNGSGKSTLLKIISGIYKPTSGSVHVGGRVVPMLELGSGFDTELTGVENIYLNGAILGFSDEFLRSKYEEILAFSELNDFIHMPIKTYSSGMTMRLAFSIATVVKPEILIVDEILSVGDEAFQRKSKARMMELMGGGTTVLFVSHDLSQIRSMCQRVIWLDKGELKAFGDVQEVCDLYADMQ